MLYKISMQTPGSFHAGSFQNTAHFIQRTQRPHGNYRVSTKPRLYHKNELKTIKNRADGRNIFSLKNPKNLLWIFFIPGLYCKFTKYFQNPFGELKFLLSLKLKTVGCAELLVLWPCTVMAFPFCTGIESIFSLSHCVGPASSTVSTTPLSFSDANCFSH